MAASTKKKLKAMGDPPCVFCGGKSSTFDHYPPKAFFKDKDVWPEGFDFPACNGCNNGSNLQDLIVSLIGRLSPGIESDEEDIAGFRRVCARLNEMNRKVLVEMFDSPEAEQKRLSVEESIGKHVSAVHVPPAAQKAIRIFAAKTTKALHYIHGKQRLLAGSTIRFAWFSNEALVRGRPTIPNELERVLGLGGEVRRGEINLKDQFDYKYALSADGATGIYYCFFRRAFAFISFVSVDQAVVEGVVERLVKGRRTDLMR